MNELSTPHLPALGLTHERIYHLTQVVCDVFTTLFGDLNPVHHDSDIARDHGFSGPIAQGAILNGFLSHFIGMAFPGPGSVILRVDMRYVSPCHAGDEIRFRAGLEQMSEASRTMDIRFIVDNVTHKTIAARGKILVQVPHGA